MTQVSPERNFSSREDTLLKNTHDIPVIPVTSDSIILGYDGHPEKFFPEMKESLAYASHEGENFAAIDQQVDGFIGILGKDLSEIQSATTDPSILIRQAEHVMTAADQLIDGATADKIAIRRRNQENLGNVVTRGLANEDIVSTQNERHARIVDVLLANRTAREGILGKKVQEFEEKIEGFRQYLAQTDPGQLPAFDAHFTVTPKTEDVATLETPQKDEIVMPTTAQMEAHLEQLTEETVSPARGISLLSSRVLEKLVIIPSKKYGTILFRR